MFQQSHSEKFYTFRGRGRGIDTRHHFVFGDFQFFCPQGPWLVDQRIRSFVMSTSVAGFEGLLQVEIEVHAWESLRINCVSFSGRIHAIKRKRTIKTSYRTMIPQGIQMTDLDLWADGIGVEMWEAIEIFGTGPEEGHPLDIINDGGLGSGHERIQGRRAIDQSPLGLVGLQIDSKSALTWWLASPAYVELMRLS